MSEGSRPPALRCSEVHVVTVQNGWLVSEVARDAARPRQWLAKSPTLLAALIKEIMESPSEWNAP